MGVWAGIKPKLSKKKTPFFVLHLTATFFVIDVQDQLAALFDKRVWGVSSPPPEKKCIVFVNDLHLAEPQDKDGVLGPLELLRIRMADGRWHKRKTLGFCQCVDVCVSASMTNGAQVLSDRVLTKYHVVECTVESVSMTRICTTSMYHYFDALGKEPALEKLVANSVEALRQVQAHLLVTPKQPQYMFGLGDASRAINSFYALQAPGDATLIHCWAHEQMRVFADRCFVDDRDRVSHVVSGKWSSGFERSVDVDRMLFGAFSSPHYALMDYGERVAHLTELGAAAESSTPCVIFEAIPHACRLVRNAPTPLALLLGTGGLGRRTVAGFLASGNNDHLVENVDAGQLGGTDGCPPCWKELLPKTGRNGQSYLMSYFSDIRADAKTWEVLSAMLLGVAGLSELLTTEETDSILQLRTTVVQDQKIPAAKTNIFHAFAARVQQNPRVVVSMGIMGFAAPIRTHPNLLRCCTIDWHGEWTTEALHSIAAQRFRGWEPALVDSVARECAMLHTYACNATADRTRQGQYLYLTPSAFFDSLQFFETSVSQKKAKRGTKKRRVEAAVVKLQETGAKMTELEYIVHEIDPVHVNWQKENAVAKSLAAAKHTAHRCPLLSDPQQQVIRYIKDLGKVVPEGVEGCRQNAFNFLRTFERGIQFGKWILAENVGGGLHQQLEPIFPSNRHSHSSAVKLGKKIVMWRSSFRLFLSTNFLNPHYGPDVCRNVQFVDFTIAAAAFEVQMVSQCCLREVPELEQQHSVLVLMSSKVRRDQESVEEEMLKLSEQKGDLIDNEALVNTELGAKKTLEEISEKIRESADSRMEVRVARNQYLLVAQQASALYFALGPLLAIDPLYEFTYFTKFSDLFTETIEEAAPCPVLSSRRANLKTHFANKINNYVAKGMWQKHPCILGLTIAPCLCEDVSPAEVVYLQNPHKNPLASLSQIPTFEPLDTFCSLFASEIRAVKEQPKFCTDGPLLGKLPGKWEHLRPFERRLFISAVRADALGVEIDDFMQDLLVQQFPTVHNPKLHEKDSSA